MVESTKPTRRKARRSTKVSRELEAARARFTEQLALQRDREAAVVAGLADYFDAGQKIAAAEQECAERVGPLEQAIAELREKRDRVVADQEAAQARAALAIHEADRTVEQVGDLLELSEKAARKLIGEGRQAAADTGPAARVTPARDSATTPSGSTVASNLGQAGRVADGSGLPEQADRGDSPLPPAWAG